MIRRILVPVVLAIHALSWATDFRLVIKADEEKFAHAGAILVHGLKFDAKDRIVAISFAQTGQPALFKISGGPENARGTVLGQPGEVKGFPGPVLSTPTEAPAGAFDAYLETFPMGVVPPAPKPTIVMKAKEAAGSPWMLITLAGVGLAAVAGILFRKRPNFGTIYVSPGKRQAIESALETMVEKLEAIEAKQEELVRKPPILRHYKRQIGGFEERLNSIEGSLRRLQDAEGRTGGALESMEQAARHTADIAEASRSITKEMAITLARLEAELSELRGRTEATEKATREASSRSAETLLAQSKQDQELQGMLFVLQEGQKSANAAAAKMADAVEALNAKAVKMESEHQAALERLHDEVQGLALQIQNLHEAHQPLDLSTISVEIENLKTALAGIPDHQAEFERIRGEISDLHQAYVSTPTPNLDGLARIERELETLREQLGTIQPNDAPAEVVGMAELSQQVADMRQEMATWRTPAPDVHVDAPDFTPLTEAMAGLQDQLKELGSGMVAAEERSHAEVEALKAEIAELAAREAELEVKQAELEAAPAPVFEPVAEAPVIIEQVEAITVMEEILEVIEEPAPEPVLVVEIEETALDESEDAQEEISAESAQVDTGWQQDGAGSARTWACSVPYPISVSGSEEMKVLTPTETPSIDAEVGGMIFAADKVIYAHGEMLRGFWPGKSASAASLKAALPMDAWRILHVGNMVFCVEEDRVEIIGLNSWGRHGSFNGTYLAQASVGTTWIGICAHDGAYKLEYRDRHGQPEAESVMLPQLGNVVGLAAAEKMTVALFDKGVAWVQGENVKTLDLNSDWAPYSVMITGSHAVVLARTPSGAAVLAWDGKKSRTLDLDWTPALAHGVCMGGTLYVDNPDGNVLAGIDLKKMEVKSSVQLPEQRVSKLIGVTCDAKRWMVAAVHADAGNSGRVVVVDAATGTYAQVCKISHPHVEIIPAEGRIVVATSCSYQNMIQVFSLPAEKVAQAA